MNIFSLVYNALFPMRCIICDIQGPCLCTTCRSKLAPAKPSNHSWITSMYDYQDHNVELLMRIIKNKPHHLLVRRLISPLSPTIGNYDMIIPIPLHRSRFIERGYNQALLIANALSHKLSSPTNTIPVREKILIKSQQTAKQGTRASRAERIENLHETFTVVTPSKITGKRILLVDDITTTGSTLSEARKTLLHAGALEVGAFTVVN